MTTEYKYCKISQIIDKECPSDQSFNEKVKRKLRKYYQLAYKMRERGYQDTAMRLYQWSLDAWEKVQIGRESKSI